MKSYTYIYSRTSEKDYRTIAHISKAICSDELQIRLEARARGLIRASDVQLEQPQWLFMKEKDCVIWGVACMNKLLAPQYSRDKTNTPIRGFVAIVIPSYHGESLPCDLESFASPFCTVMDKLFFSYDTSINDIEIDMPNDIKTISPIGWTHALNTDIRYCKIMPNSIDGMALLQSAMGYSGDISIAVNVATEKSVNDKNVCPPMNAVMRDEARERMIETGLNPPMREPIIIQNDAEDADGHILSDDDSPLDDTPIRHPVYKYFLLVLAFAIVLFFAYKHIHRAAGEKENNAPYTTEEKDSLIENENKQNQHTHGISEQDRRFYEGADDELSGPIPERTESRSIETPTTPMSNPEGNYGDAQDE